MDRGKLWDYIIYIYDWPVEEIKEEFENLSWELHFSFTPYQENAR